MTAVAPAQRKATVDEVYDPDDEQERLGRILDGYYERMLTALHQIVSTAFPEAGLRLDDPAVRRILLQAATRVVRIDESTRRAIADMIAVGQERGYSSWEIANGVPKDGYRGIQGLFTETWASRAETVARTELQEAQRIASIDRYQSTGLVDRVEIVDGDEDSPCKERNGKVVPIEQAPGLGHPNCTLVLIPVLREGID